MKNAESLHRLDPTRSLDQAGSARTIAIYEYFLSNDIVRARALDTVTIAPTFVLVAAAIRLPGTNVADIFR
jgi:hypothetical protein